jgi:cytoskeleton protein RodZ
MPTEFSPASVTSLGQRLRVARTAQGLTVEDVAAQLKLPVAIVEAMESDDHAVLGAAIYARGRLGNYARLLGLPAALVDTQFASGTVPPPPLVSSSRDTRFERGLQRVGRQGIYVVLTATIVLPVIWLATHHQLPQSTASLTTLDAPPVTAQVAKKPAASQTATNEQAPVAASIAPFATYRSASTTETAAAAQTAATATPNAAAAPDGGLQLRFSGDSWIEVTAPDGHVLERGMVEAGTVRDYRNGVVGRLAIGNVNSVLVLQSGKPLDLSAFSRANVARFTLSPDGKPVPAGD